MLPNQDATCTRTPLNKVTASISGNFLNLPATLSVSLILHLAALVLAGSIQFKTQPVVSRGYIPVELVQLAQPPRVVKTPVLPAAPPPSKTPVPVTTEKLNTPAPPAAAYKPASIQPVLSEAASAPGAIIQSRTAIPTKPTASANSGTAPPVSGNVAHSSASATSGGTPGTLANGDYHAFHRLTRLPSFRSKAEPVYPDAERMAGSEARIIAEIYLNERGGVDNVIIKKSGGRYFDKAVIDAARQSSFHPGYMGEKAVPAVIQIPYSFKLN